MLIDSDLHLTYCTNIHAADGWQAVFANLRTYAPALKARFSPSAPFGIGLRLSAREARELLDGGRLSEFRDFLDREGLYVAIINGFPYGHFHGQPVKETVYAPDWRDPARVGYTLDLIEIVSRLVPEGLDGGVSTAPLSYKAWMIGADSQAWRTIVAHVVRVAAALVRLRQSRGTLIHLDIEPEPDCSIENTEEAIEFFDRWLIPVGAPALASALGVSTPRAEQQLREHIRLCFDCCHFAVEFEEPAASLLAFERAGIRIGRVQLSSALRAVFPKTREEANAVAAALRPFADATYLHQVIERRNGSLHRYPDLDVALDNLGSEIPEEWRIHFHVPLFAGEYEAFGSTQDYVRTVIDLARTQRFTHHLEIETYTWDVLPARLKVNLQDSIAREYEWVLQQS
ncbi:MAG: metabolite traffic protein EboE [Gemmatimonadaceae bacterium]